MTFLPYGRQSIDQSDIDAVIEDLRGGAVVFPAKVYGSNALLAYTVSWLIGPLVDLNWISAPKA